ncbi:MAG: hypothetical protein ABI743_04335 [bacterium]
MRLAPCLWTASLALLALGCGSSSNSPLKTPSVPLVPETPSAPAAIPGQAALGQAIVNGDIAQSALALYAVTIDPGTLAATAQLKATREGAANDDLYLLPIDSFLKPSSFEITGFTSDPATLALNYQFAHPFPAPSDPTGTPNGSTNRADLGVDVQLILLVDAPTATGNTYFTDRVLNTSLISNADVYWSPEALVDTTGFIANTFPVFNVVDEAADNRVGISNGGDPTGNFGADGWTRDELGATHDQWTGGNILHQGQSATGSMQLDKAALSALGGFTFDVAVIAKYQDPRGGANGVEKKANRLPPPAADPTKFAYRMSHAAIALPTGRFDGESGGFYTDTVSASTLQFHVTDWVARAIETTETDLSAELDVTKVAIGESGLPQFAVCIPGVLGDATAVDVWDPNIDVADDDSLAGGDLAVDSGLPGDSLFFSKSVTKLVTSGQTDGTYTGLARATAASEAAISDPNFVIELNGALAPLVGTAPKAEVYQVFTVSMISPNGAPSATVTPPATAVASGNGTLTLTVDPYSDPDSDPIDIRFDWDNNGDYLGTGEGYQTLDGTAPDSIASPIFYSNATAAPVSLDVPFQYTDNVVSPISGSVTFTLGANQPPAIQGGSGSVTLLAASLPSPATFTLNVTGGPVLVSDPEGDTVDFTVRATPTAAGVQTASGIAVPNGYNGTPVMGPWNAPNSPITFAVFANDTNHAGTSGTAVPTSPASLVGTVSCGLTMAAVNTTLATLTTGSVLRAGIAPDQVITGIRVGWTDIAGEAQYAIQRGTWANGATVASVAFSTIGTAVANATSYDDLTANASGNRYLYRVVPRCAVGSLDGTPSQLAMVVLQDFETYATGDAFAAAPVNGWTLHFLNNTSPVFNITNAANSLNGTRGLRANEFGTAPTPIWETFNAPLLNDRAALGTLSTSIFEFNHAWGNGGNNQSGYSVLSNTAAPTDGDAVVPTDPNNWRWSGAAVSGTDYNDPASSAFTNAGTGWFSNINAQVGAANFNFGNSATSVAIPETYSRFDTTVGVITNTHLFMGIAFATTTNGSNEDAKFDDMAWIVY